MKSPETCPVCGSDVPPRASACPACGPDEKTGWADDAYAASPNIPDDDFDYGDFVEREFGSKKPVPRGVHWGWLIGAIVLVILLLLPLLLALFRT